MRLVRVQHYRIQILCPPTQMFVDARVLQLALQVTIHFYDELHHLTKYNTVKVKFNPAVSILLQFTIIESRVDLALVFCNNINNYIMDINP